MEQVLYEVKKTIVGQDALLERLLVALLSRGHILVEGVPGLAKTLAVKALAGAIGGQFHRVQFTPDLVPADIVGTRVYHQRSGEFQVSLGPVFTNLLLADEINRAPAKVQSALLEVMQEQQVTIGRETHQVPQPFLVMATQNPIESEGTYPLPEAQVDRFMMKVVVGYPSPTEEFVIVERAISPAADGQAIVDPEQLIQMQAQVEQVYVDPALIEYAVRLANATRRPAEVGLGDLARYISFGASPRASINLVLAARALAFIRGRDYVVPQDLTELALDVFRHRLVLSYEALSDDVTADTVLTRVTGRAARAGRAAAAGAADHDQRARPAAAAPGVAGGRAGSTGGCRAPTAPCSAAPASTSPSCGSTRPEDDVRHIDWNVTARLDEPYVRQYTEDRELTAWLVLDRSASMRFGARRSAARTRCSPSSPSAWPGCSPRAATGSARSSTTTGSSASSRPAPAAPTCCAWPTSSTRPVPTPHRTQHHRPGRHAATGRVHRAPAQPGLRHLRLHRRRRLGAGADPAEPPARGGRDPDRRPDRAGPARPRTGPGRGRRDRRAGAGRHQRPAVPAAVAGRGGGPGARRRRPRCAGPG